MSFWSNYVHVVGEDVRQMWADPEATEPVYLLGEGFDPRMLVGLKEALEAKSLDDLAVLSLGLAEPGGRSARAQQAAENMAELESLVADHQVRHERVTYPQIHERRSLSRPLLAGVLAAEVFRGADQVIVDISALPVGVYFGLIKGLLDTMKTDQRDPELQVVVAENATLDSCIKGSGVDTPAAILGFALDSELTQARQRPPLVWAPVLGEGAGPQLEALEDSLRPDEICPVLPFPARDPRHADRLLIEAKELLVDRFEVEPSNYIYADERNPFDLYRALGRLQERYKSALQPLGDATVVISVHASKSLSLGALLAAYEYGLPAFNAEPAHYDFDLGQLGSGSVAATELSGAWLMGKPTR